MREEPYTVIRAAASGMYQCSLITVYSSELELGALAVLLIRDFWVSLVCVREVDAMGLSGARM